VAEADARGLAVAGLGHAAGTPSPRAVQAFTPLNRRTADKYLRRDMARAANVRAVVADNAACAGVVVVRRHVIAIETGEGLTAMFDRVKALRQWGATARSKRRGALAVAAVTIEAMGIDAAIAAAADAGLAGLVLPPDAEIAVIDRAGAIAESHGLAVTAAAGPWQRGAA
jgi:DUF1009 family protein